jgi:hypothetical protein
MPYQDPNSEMILALAIWFLPILLFLIMLIVVFIAFLAETRGDTRRRPIEAPPTRDDYPSLRKEITPLPEKN